MEPKPLDDTVFDDMKCTIIPQRKLGGCCHKLLFAKVHIRYFLIRYARRFYSRLSSSRHTPCFETLFLSLLAVLLAPFTLPDELMENPCVFRNHNFSSIVYVRL